MAKLKIKEVQDIARRIIASSPGGIRYSALVKHLAAKHPETPVNTIHGSVWDLDKKYPNEIQKPSRGLFVPASSNGDSAPSPTTAGTPPEQEFYQSFAEWLKNDLDEATEAVPLGGSGLKGKWGTPDVVGTFKPLASNRVKFDLEIISAEIKTASSEAITAFGQATAYRLFSHKVYLVMPNTLPELDQSRLESLALLFGIGFVQFDPNIQDPHYRVRVRAQRFLPDMFYVNEFADRLHDHDTPTFNKLFQ